MWLANTATGGGVKVGSDVANYDPSALFYSTKKKDMKKVQLAKVKAEKFAEELAYATRRQTGGGRFKGNWT